jgi:four helix bundle protein
MSWDEKEASESQYWLELFEEADIGDKEDREWLVRECREVLAIFTEMGKTAESRRSIKR